MIKSDSKAQSILKGVLEGTRLSEEEATFLLKEGDILALGQAAREICQRKHPDNQVTFIIDRNINYTNICISQCKFCAFYRRKDDSDAYTLSRKEILAKIEETINLNGTQILLQGGLHPDLTLDYYVDLFRSIKEGFDIQIHSLSPPEIHHISKISFLSIPQTFKELRRAGLDSLPGGGAEILVDHVRHVISPNKITSSTWLEIMEEAQKLGMITTATMMMGSIETIEDRVEHLAKIRNLQDKTAGFVSFIPWTYHPDHTKLGGRAISSMEYLKMLSVSRLFLDNFDNVQGSWVSQGKEIGQTSLHFGANDLGSIMIEENVLKAAGVSYKMSVDEMLRLISKAGKIPAQRDTGFAIVREFEGQVA
jgi:cyclic dehypoxanthinyl futalosine synthase